MPNAVIETPAAPSDRAIEHFQAELSFETDCWDVHEALSRTSNPGFVLIDARSSDRFAWGHIPGAINLPHRKIIASRMASYPPSTLFITYCAGPHCNGAARAALRLARLGLPVKVMTGGVTGWLDEGFDLQAG